MSLIYLRRNMRLNYRETLRTLPRVIFSLLILLVMGIAFNILLPTHTSSRILQIVIIAISGIFCGGVYFIINIKAICSVLPEKLVSKLRLSRFAG